MLKIDTVTSKAGFGPRSNHVAAEIEEADDEFVTTRHPYCLCSPYLAELAEQSSQHRLQRLGFSSRFPSVLGRPGKREALEAIRRVLLATPIRYSSAVVV